MSESFNDILSECSPDADQKLIKRASDAFLRHYQLCKGKRPVTAIDALAISFPLELLPIRNAGLKCQMIYDNTREAAKERTSLPVRDILNFKRYLYRFHDSKFKYTSSGIDRMVIQLAKCGITSREGFELLGGMALAYPEDIWCGDERILRKAYTELTKMLHPEVKNPITVIVDYVDENERISYTAVDENKQRSIVDRLKKKDYEVSSIRKFEDMPVQILYVRKKVKK